MMAGPTAVLAAGLALWLSSERAVTEDENVRLQITEKDDGKELSVTAGQGLTVALPCQPGAGYAWTILVRDEKRIEVLGEPRIEARDSKRFGGVERHVFRFRALAPGSTALELGLTRKWEKEQKPKRVFRVGLTIR